MSINNNVAVSNTGFVFNPITGESFSTNQIGSDIINLMKENKDFNAIKTFVLGKYEVDEITFEKDYYDFVSILKSYSIIEPNN